jgi:hypothetical protein
MWGEHTRRRFLRAGVAATGVASILGRASAATRLSNTIEIGSDGGGIAAYEFSVNGDLRQEDWDDHVDGNRAYGHVGAKRGTDTFSYSGDVTGFCLAGPATAYRNGVRTIPAFYPAPDGNLAARDFPSGSGTRLLRIESDGGGMAAYQFEVNGSMSQVDWDDHVMGRQAYGHVGPDRGADEFEISGDVTRFCLAGPATVYLDGTEVSPSSGGVERTAFRASPQRDITATPKTTLLFEAAARGYRGDRVRGDWYVDGQLRAGPGAFHSQTGGPGLSTFTTSFGDEGSHRVHADLYDGDGSSGDGDPIGSVNWTVHVSADGNQPPPVELVEPSSDATVSESSDRRRFEAAAHDPEGALDRMVWWQSQCDAVVAIDPVSGGSATSSISFAPDYGCPLGVRAIDRNGAMSELKGWTVERSD